MGIRNAVLAAVQNQNTNINQQEERAPAEFYLNIGIETGDPQFPFIDLCKSGIALDRVPENNVRGSADTPYKQFLASQDALRQAFLDRAGQIAPGETAIIALDEETGLAMQIRRVADKASQPVVTAELKGLAFR